VLQSWTFDRPGDFSGWTPNAHVTQATVDAASLSGRCVGPDPILEYQPSLAIDASPWQAVEIRLRSSKPGTAELFWSPTREGRYGGFSQAQSTRFRIDGDPHWHTYRILPFWQQTRRIVRLRLDLFDDTTFDLGSIRILEWTPPPLVDPPRFDASAPACPWHLIPTRTEEPSPGMTTTLDQLLLSPPVQVSAAAFSIVSLVLSVPPTAGSSEPAPVHAALGFATDQQPGLQSHRFTLLADGREHRYNLDLLDCPSWRGTILALALHLPGAAPPGLRSLAVSDQPQGPPELRVEGFALADPLPRTGRPTPLRLTLRNLGAETATNIDLALALPPGLRLLDPVTRTQQVASLRFDEEATLEWRVHAEILPHDPIAVHVVAPNAAAVTQHCPASFRTPPVVPPTDYVPVPQPVRGPFDVGAYYFPGWKTASAWSPIQRFPERQPVLGWYREGDPEVADWHIKWAVEHGFTFFAYDWYWSQGTRQLEHALHQGYFNARYRRLLKFCLLWANHNPPGSSSPEDCLDVTRYWIDHYFRRPEYFAPGGKPLVILFSPDRLTADLGTDRVRPTLEAMRAECVRAGLPGLWLAACVGDTGQGRTAFTQGYDAVTGYNWPSLGMTGEGLFAPYASLLAGYRNTWESLRALGPLIVPLSGGWDSRPWHGENNIVRFGRTPPQFRLHLDDAFQFLDRHTARSPLDCIALIEAWNEWGEGSYIEPHQEFGFGYLDEVREVFTSAPRDHLDLAPADVGRGPYDVDPLPAGRTSWDFAHEDQGWDHTMDLADREVHGGALCARSIGPDPALFGPPMDAAAGSFARVRVRMRLTVTVPSPATDRAQLFWTTRRSPESEASSERFEVALDGAWHEYTIPVGHNPRWRGRITRLRLDPGNRAGISIAISNVQLVPGPP